MPNTDTILSNHNKEILDLIADLINNALLSSHIATFVFTIATGILFLSIASMFDEENSNPKSYIVSFLIFGFLVIPVNTGGKRVYNLLTDSTSKIIDLTFGQVTELIAKKHKENALLPPSYIPAKIDQALSSSITDKSINNMIKESATNCLPVGKNNTGGNISARDIFEVEMINNQSVVYKNFDSSLLKTRKLNWYNPASRVVESVSCFDFVTATHFAIRKNINAQLKRDPDSSFSGSEEIGKIIERINKNTKGSKLRKNVDNVALNIAHLNSIKNSIYSKNNPKASVSFYDDFISAEHSDAFRGHSLAGAYLTASSSWANIKRSFNIDGMGDAVGKMKDLNDRSNKMPYYIATIKSMIMIIFPFVLLAGFLNYPKGLFIWAMAWVGACITPHLLFISRMISNINQTSVLRFLEPITQGEYSSNYLIQQMALSSMRKVLDDTAISLSASLDVEYYIVGIVMTALPALGFMAGGKSSTGALGRVGSWAGQAFTGIATRKIYENIGNESRDFNLNSIGSDMNTIGGSIASVGSSVGGAVAPASLSTGMLGQKNNPIEKFSDIEFSDENIIN